MVAIASFPGGDSFVGTDTPELLTDGEGPRRAVRLKPFRLEACAVTVERFAAFVTETGYVSEAERLGWSAVFAGFLADGLGSGRPDKATDWWRPVTGACWRCPEGPGSTIEDRADHPATHISWSDASAFAAWAGGRLPTEAEWEHAARDGAGDRRFPWGDADPTDAKIFCNIWQGSFPSHNTLADGHYGTCPVDAFPPNSAGLFNMSGNVWEWTSDPFRVRSLSREAQVANRRATEERLKVVKGGSFLCHISYCYRYRIAARIGLPPDSAASNSGFRIAYDA